MDASNNKFDVNKRIAEIRDQINMGRARSEVMRDRLAGLGRDKAPDQHAALFDRLFSGARDELAVPIRIPLNKIKEEPALS